MSVISILHLASNFYVSDIIDIAHLTMNTHHTMDTHDIRDTHHMMDTHYTMDAHYDDEHPSYDGQPSLECHESDLILCTHGHWTAMNTSQTGP